MKLEFINGNIAEAEVIKETKKYLTIQLATGFKTKYRVNKETGEVQDNTYHNIIKGLHLID